MVCVQNRILRLAQNNLLSMGGEAMFGFVTANLSELTQEEKSRYTAVYCGICRQIRARSSQSARLSLSYDMAFLGLLLMSLYEPEEASGKRACGLHPVKPRPWVENRYIEYCADMNVALAYFSCLDNWKDDKSLSAKAMAAALKPHCKPIAQRYPRQWAAIEENIQALSRLEKENCGNIDAPAGCFGRLMAELLVYEEDLWAEDLRQTGQALGRFIYLADAAADYKKDLRRHKYNPFIAMGTGENWPQWEEYLVLAMGRCTQYFEKLPLVQDKNILDNILYSGVWTNFKKKAGRNDATGSL